MPRGERVGAIDARALHIEGAVNVAAELAYLRAGSEPPWERPHRSGADITDRPELWTVYQRRRREAFNVRVAQYRTDGKI